MLYRIAYIIFWPFFKVAYRIRFVGRDNIPVDGPVLIVSNHASYLDPICLGLASSKRQIHFMARDDLFRIPALKQILPRVNSFPVKRDSSDRKALKEALKRLKADEVVGVFPQGTRVKEGELGAGELGSALIALKSGAYVLPTAVIGSNMVMPKGMLPRFPKITVSFGQPFKVEENDKDKKVVMKEATVKMMDMIDGLITQEKGSRG